VPLLNRAARETIHQRGRDQFSQRDPPATRRQSDLALAARDPSQNQARTLCRARESFFARGADPQRLAIFAQIVRANSGCESRGTPA